MFTDEEKSRLLHISFVNDEREEIPELPEEEPVPVISQDNSGNAPAPARELSERHHLRFDFWSHFVEYCVGIGREKDIASRKPSNNDWYDVTVGSRDYHVFFQLYRKKVLRIGLYVYRPEDFARLDSRKDEIEAKYGSVLEWYTSREKSTSKRILHSVDADVHNPQLYPEHFAWLVSQYDKLVETLKSADPEGFSDGDDTSGGKITPQMTEAAYAIARKVYDGQLGRTEGKDEIARTTGMAAGSASDYISDLLYMMNGEAYARTLNEYATRYFLERIRSDYGEIAFEKALEACKKHAAYYATLGHGCLAYVDRIIEEYSK